MVRLFLLILFLSLLCTVLYSLMKDLFKQRQRTGGSGSEELVQDPYCQTYIPKRTAVRKRVGGREYYFCDKECRTKFLHQKKSQK